MGISAFRTSIRLGCLPKYYKYAEEAVQLLKKYHI